MNNNLAKNRFFYRSIQLDLTIDKISIKQIILQKLQNTITSRFPAQKENYIRSKLLQILNSLPDKLILTESIDLSSFVYSCAIAFPLANLWGLPSRQVAQELASSFAINHQNSFEKLSLQFTVKVIKNGLIEFSLSDRSVGYWLGLVMRRLREQGQQRCTKLYGVNDPDATPSDKVPSSKEPRTQNTELGKTRSWARRAPREEKQGDDNLFPVQYVYHRCSSLLLLGAREGLINLNSVGSNNIWQIINPNPFKYYCDENISYCYEPAEINLLHQLMLVIDCLHEYNAENPQTLIKYTLNLSNTCLIFLADCRIFGSVSQDKPDLAIARLGLIAIVQSYLQKSHTSFR